MDSFDQKIIAALQKNARQSVSSIAEQVSLSRTAVSERIKRLEATGEILGYQVLTASQAETGERLKAYFEISHGGMECAPFVQELMKFPEVKRCHGTSGDVDLLVYVDVSNMQRLHDLLSAVTKLKPPGARIRTHMIMREWYR
ncbi:Lrp/AsnC family transcriptional regulator [Pontibacterium granulatum]|uniref:Lrp/AsnC family transcriptional regulator n=1 Tax=Pontibacterium granulatum TaxID=2036029 RepID=UPI00249C1D0E|nr:Lrp/AsnC family transcriptional regulator [Pontibacterium granulatum]MDI3325267.1 Lrp/AsnC family transcriptional regulator [Pontibacterium granulatum]